MLSKPFENQVAADLLEEYGFHEQAAQIREFEPPTIRASLSTEERLFEEFIEELRYQFSRSNAWNAVARTCSRIPELEPETRARYIIDEALIDIFD